MFVVLTISFGLLYGLVILRQSRRELLWLGATAHPNAEWLARQLTGACGWDEPPSYLICDRDEVYGAAFIRRVAAMGIRDRPTSARSPWQNGYAERPIGSIRRECLDHVVVLVSDIFEFEFPTGSSELRPDFNEVARGRRSFVAWRLG